MPAPLPAPLPAPFHHPHTAWRPWATALACASFGCGAPHAQSLVSSTADDTPADRRAAALDAVVVLGRGEQRIGKVAAASEGGVAGADLAVRPLLRTAELLEAVPGLIAAQHSGSGKANQYFLRGFNLDHGTDFSLVLDGVPMNFRTHGHGQGYLDVNGLIPELVQRIDYRKGPYRADAGDFSMVGMATATTLDSVEQPYAAVETGRFGWRRLLGVGSLSLGPDSELLLAGEAKGYNGPWALAEQLRHRAFYAKLSQHTALGMLRTSLSIYQAGWRPTEQIPERAVGSVIPNPYGAIDPALQGRTARSILSTQLEGQDWRANAYLQRYDWHLTSNFTFFLDDPVLGDQIEQVDQRWVSGGRVERSLRLTPTLTWTTGVETRLDQIGKVGLYQSLNGQRSAPQGVFAVSELSLAAYSEATWRWREDTQLLGGVRADRYRFHTRSLEGPATWGDTVAQTLASPKLGLSQRLAPGWAAYANWGRGFHSNDARGVTAPSERAPGLVAGTGRELGLRFERPGLVLSATQWWMKVGSELLYVGDSGSVEPSGASRRRGYELTAFWRPRPWLSLDANWSGSHARYANAPGADHIPGALDSAGELGLSTVFEHWNAALRVRHMGAHALTEDNRQRAQATTQLNLRAAWTAPRWELYAELLNALNSHRSDVEYVYTSRLPGEPLEGVEGVHSRVVEPRSLRVGMKLKF